MKSSSSGSWVVVVVGIVLLLAACQSPPNRDGEEEPTPGLRPPPPDIYGEELDKLNPPLDIHPIQVVQDPPHEALREEIPLVAEKQTMVRVFVTLPAGSPGVANVRCTLWWNGAAHQITAHLVPVLGRTWVIPLADWPRFAAMRPAIVNLANADGRFWAYNFTFGAGLPAPLPPAPLILTATLDVNGQAFAGRIETSQQDFKIKAFAGGRAGANFVAVVRAFRSGGVVPRPFLGAPAAAHAALVQEAQEIEKQLLAVFPIPKSRLTMNLPPPPPAGAIFDDNGGHVDQFAGPLSHTTVLETRFPAADGIFMVTNDGFKRGVGGVLGGNQAGWTPTGSDRVHYLSWKEPLTDLVSAHEKGHDTNYFGAPHTPLTRVEDGWDAGAHIFRVSSTTRDRNNLMFQAAAGVRDDPWIVPEEYRRALDRLVAGGKDPVLIALSGILRAKGTLELAPATLRMGVTPPSVQGHGSLVMLGQGNDELARVSFPVIPVQDDAEVRECFSVEAELPESARRLVIELPGGQRHELAVAETPPSVAIGAVELSADGRFAEVSVQTAEPDTQLRWIYSREGSTQIDVPGTRLSEGRYRIDLGGVAGGPAGRLIVSASRGLRLAEVSSAPFALPDRQPWLYVWKENDGPQAVAYDPEDGFLAPQWFANEIIPVGEGDTPDAERAKLVAGKPVKLDVRVRDRAGQEVVLPATP